MANQLSIGSQHYRVDKLIFLISVKKKMIHLEISFFVHEYFSNATGLAECALKPLRIFDASFSVDKKRRKNSLGTYSNDRDRCESTTFSCP